MNELIDEILSDEKILMNEALELLTKELNKFDQEKQKEIKADLKHAFLGV